MAGLYATWRLLGAGARPDRIRLFEASGRIGGRVLTVHSPQGLALDMGAHNFSPSHTIVAGLVERFELKPLESTGQSPAGIVHLRGRSLTNSEISRSWFRKPFLYDVSAYLQRRGPARILRKALKNMPAPAPGNERQLRGRPLAEWALPDALLEVLTPEELAYVADRLIYSFWHQPVHAHAALKWAAQEMFRGKGGMSELEGGMAALPEAMSRAIESHGARITLRHRLVAVKLSNEGGPIPLSFETEEGHISVTAARVVLAMPAAGVARVDGLAERPDIQALLSALVPQNAVTTALVYALPWWREIGIRGGASTTDLPARHLRHHGGEPWRGSDAGALVSYSDGKSAQFWHRLGGGAPTSGWISPDHPVARELHSQAQRMFGPKMQNALPQPTAALSQDWDEAAAGAAFHMWSSGSTPADVMRRALCPVPGQRLHICGEAWSPRQGWIEGALESVDMMLDREILQDRSTLPSDP
jgi:monoamine oxidase